jgi:CBS domain-containing protein
MKTDHYRRDVVTISGGALVRDAADLMRDKATGSLVVTAEGGGAVGIVTDRDLLERVIAESRDVGVTHVADVMTQPLHTASPEDPLDRVVGLMSARGIRRVPIVENGQLLGIVSLDDVLAEVADELHDLAEGRRTELRLAERGARARELAREFRERVRELGEQLEDLGVEAKNSLVREIDGLRERMRARGA